MSDKKQGKQFKEFAPEIKSVTIRGHEYKLREMSLAEKIRVLGPIAEIILKNIAIKRPDGKGFEFDIPERFNLSELNVDQMLMTSTDALPEILKLSVPDFADWDNLPESETREPLLRVMEANDFLGFALNFISVAGKAMSSVRL